MVELRLTQCSLLPPHRLPLPTNSGLATSKTQHLIPLQVAADSLNILKTSPTAGCELTLAGAPGRQKAWLTANSAHPHMQNGILALGT